MRKLLVVLVGACVLVSRPARAAETDWFQPPQLRDALLLGAAETLIAVDVLQTLDLQDRRRHPYAYEVNPLLGLHPSSAKIVGVGVAGGLLAAAVWYALPSRVRWVLPVFLGLGEGLVIAGNANAGAKIRF